MKMYTNSHPHTKHRNKLCSISSILHSLLSSLSTLLLHSSSTSSFIFPKCLLVAIRDQRRKTRIRRCLGYRIWVPQRLVPTTIHPHLRQTAQLPQPTHLQFALNHRSQRQCQILTYREQRFLLLRTERAKSQTGMLSLAKSCHSRKI